MKQLTIISGKGGTGKTTVTAAFSLLAPNAVLADTDVDAADLHLILEPEIKHQEPYSGGLCAEIDPAACTSCGLCATLCRFSAISECRVDPVSCEGCRLCLYACPEQAVTMQEKQSGTWFVSTTRAGSMVHAKLGIAEDNSGKLVNIVRQKAKSLAEENGNSLVIIDGPPGIGCPVIAAITATDMVLVVTEPTLSGLHDLERVLETAGHFSVPAMVCINKYDINPNNTARIEQYCDEHQVRVVGKIPYDKTVTAAMIHKKAVTEYDCGRVAEEVRAMWKQVSAALLDQ